MDRSTLERLRAEALKLPELDRAELAHQLVASLEGASDSGEQEMWNTEILRRVAEIDAGSAKLIDREEFSRRMRARMRRA